MYEGEDDNDDAITISSEEVELTPERLDRKFEQAKPLSGTYEDLAKSFRKNEYDLMYEAAKNEVDADDTVITVKFIIPPKNRVFTNSYLVRFTLGEVMNSLSNIFNMLRETIILTHEGEQMPRDTKLRDLNIDPYGILTLGLTNTSDLVFKVDDLYKDMAIADVITVHCETSIGEQYDLVVEIEDRSIVKPFTGGYRNKKDKKEYHHAFTQTGPPPPRVDPSLKQSKECQSLVSKDGQQQTSCNNATQMQNEHIHIPNVTDKIMTAGRYKSYAEIEDELQYLEKIKLIQKNFRAYLWMKLIKETAAEYRRLLCLKMRTQVHDDEELSKERKKTIIHQTYPRVKTDFVMLQSMIADWHRQETEQIREKYSAAPKHAEFAMLLDKEIAMLKALDAHKVNTAEDNAKLECQRIIHLSQKPIKWIGYKGLRIEMDSLRTQHARRLAEIFRTIIKEQTVEARLETLLSLKEALQERPNSLTTDLIELIDRECEFLIRELDDKDLKFLRKRITQLLFEYIKDPGASGCNKYINCLTSTDYYLCKYCYRMKPARNISLHAATKFLNTCSSCFTMGQSSRKNYAPYARMLKMVREHERRNNCLGAVAFLMNAVDMQRLVETIWHAKSLLSEIRGELFAPRWDKNVDWAPWNCVVLTREEAEAHKNIRVLEEAYNEKFIVQVKLKHSQARNMFKQLAEVDESFVESGDWDKAHCTKEDCLY